MFLVLLRSLLKFFQNRIKGKISIQRPCFLFKWLACTTIKLINIFLLQMSILPLIMLHHPNCHFFLPCYAELIFLHNVALTPSHLQIATTFWKAGPNSFFTVLNSQAPLTRGSFISSKPQVVEPFYSSNIITSIMIKYFIPQSYSCFLPQILHFLNCQDAKQFVVLDERE